MFVLLREPEGFVVLITDMKKFRQILVLILLGAWSVFAIVSGKTTSNKCNAEWNVMHKHDITARLQK